MIETVEPPDQAAAITPPQDPPSAPAPQGEATGPAPAPSGFAPTDAALPEPRLPRPRAATFVLTLLALMPAGLAAQALLPPAGLVWTELVVFALPAAALAARAGLRAPTFLRLGRPPRLAFRLAVPLGLLAMVTGGAIQSAWSALLPPAVVETFDVTRIFDAGPLPQAILVLAAVGLAPICEELAFRGHLLSALRLRWSVRGAIGLSAVAFAAIHLDPVRFPALIVLGVIYGWLSWRTGSVWPSVLAHAVNNAAATALALAWPEAGKSAGPTPPIEEALAALAASLALMAPLVLAYQRTMPPPPSPEAALERREARPGRWPSWAVRGAWAAAAALAVIGTLGRR
jgi:membrane protease YdiL (CAAX protease family)